MTNMIEKELDDVDFTPDLKSNIQRLITASQANNTTELIQTKRDLGRTKHAQDLKKRQKA